MQLATEACTALGNCKGLEVREMTDSSLVFDAPAGEPGTTTLRLSLNGGYDWDEGSQARRSPVISRLPGAAVTRPCAEGSQPLPVTFDYYEAAPTGPPPRGNRRPPVATSRGRAGDALGRACRLGPKARSGS